MKKINIANILKHCPKGMKLDCTIWGWNIEFDHINIKDEYYPIVCHDKCPDGKYNIRTFTKYGYYSISDSKCVIFPKGETTWEGFAPPCKFKDGDIIYTKDKLGTEFVSIFRLEYERDICIYWNMNLSANKLIGSLHDGNAFKFFIEKDKVKEQRFATEEEKQKLFKAFKDNGYTWNTETKTLDKLPKFKDGDIISNILTNSICIFKGEGSISGTVDFYCGICCNEFFIKDNIDPIKHFGYIKNYHLATEKEKQKFFDDIKSKGYK